MGVISVVFPVFTNTVQPLRCLYMPSWRPSLAYIGPRFLESHHTNSREDANYLLYVVCFEWPRYCLEIELCLKIRRVEENEIDDRNNLNNRIRGDNKNSSSDKN